MTSSATMNI